MTVSGALTRRLEAAGQAHLVAHALSLDAVPAARFVAELESVAWERLVAALKTSSSPLPPDLRPPEALTLRRQRNEPGALAPLAALVKPLLAAGRVAAVLLAGGQGTRLGHAGPKGTFALGPTPDRTLYAILMERLLADGRRAGAPVPVVVLTGPDTDAPTRAAFEASGFFGHDKALVRFVRQGVLPAVDDGGRALLAAPGRLALSPDGHGGLVSALEKDGAFDWLAARGVEIVTTFQVDNALARPLDPVFLGWMLSRKAVAAGKAVRKSSPEEAVGVFGRDFGGRVRIVEYTENKKGATKEPLFPELVLGSIAIHAFSLPWLRALFANPSFALPYHRALKKVAHLDASGRLVEPAKANATKLEQYLFDLLPFAPRVAIQEVDRRREFAPVKNAVGEDSPETSRAAVSAEIARWHRAAGIAVPDPVPPLRPLDFDSSEDLKARHSGG